MTAKVETLLPHYYLTMSSAGPAKLLPIMYNQNEEKYPDTDQYIPPRKSGLCVCLFVFIKGCFLHFFDKKSLFWILPVYRNFGIFRIEFWATFSQVCSVGLVLQNINRCYLKKKCIHTQTHTYVRVPWSKKHWETLS